MVNIPVGFSLDFPPSYFANYYRHLVICHRGYEPQCLRPMVKLVLVIVGVVCSLDQFTQRVAEPSTKAVRRHHQHTTIEEFRIHDVSVEYKEARTLFRGLFLNKQSL